MGDGPFWQTVAAQLPLVSKLHPEIDLFAAPVLCRGKRLAAEVARVLNPPEAVADAFRRRRPTIVWNDADRDGLRNRLPAETLDDEPPTRLIRSRSLAAISALRCHFPRIDTYRPDREDGGCNAEPSTWWEPTVTSSHLLVPCQ